MSLPLHDPALGLGYVANNEALYRKVLGKFAAQQANAAADIAAALERGDIELAQRLAHTLKGLAASMGLPLLTQTATGLDAVLKSGDEPRHMLPELADHLAQSLDAVQRYLG